MGRNLLWVALLLAIVAGAATMARRPAAPSEQVLADGLRIQDVVVGKGPEVRPHATVSCLYRGTFLTGRVFDDTARRGNQPFTFQLGRGQLIRGWEEGLFGMRVGGKRRLIIPPALAYGARGVGNLVPPNATLIFDIELVDVK